MRILLALALGGALVSSGGAPVSAVTNARTEQRCHPSYPDFCIPPPPPDLDCPDIPANRKPFRVRHDVARPDPHGFDRDRDGRACEPRPRTRRG